FDAVTGDRISTEGLNVTLVQGDDYRKAKINKDFQGDFFVGDIPTSTANNITYRLDVSYAGYQPFTSLITFGVNTAGLQDKKAAMIGNVYLFPLGTTAPDMNIEVFYEGERVEGAEVLLQPETGSNVLTTDSSSVISPTLGYQKALSVTTDADGIATLAGTSLVLGGRYKVQVLPTTYKGIQLGLENNATTVTVGTSTIRQRVDMAHILPANNNGLYVVSASNENFDGINSSGILAGRI